MHLTLSESKRGIFLISLPMCYIYPALKQAANNNILAFCALNEKHAKLKTLSTFQQQYKIIQFSKCWQNFSIFLFSSLLISKIFFIIINTRLLCSLSLKLLLLFNYHFYTSLDIIKNISIIANLLSILLIQRYNL